MAVDDEDVDKDFDPKADQKQADAKGDKKSAAADDDIDDVPEGKGSKKLLFIIIGVVVGIIFVGGLTAGLTYYFLKTGTQEIDLEANIKKIQSEEGKPTDAKAAGGQEAKPKALFYRVTPSFLVKLEPGRSQSSFLEVEVVIMSRHSGVISEVRTNDPLIKNDILAILSKVSRKSALTKSGKIKIQQDILDKVNEILISQGIDEKVESILFTKFVVQ